MKMIKINYLLKNKFLSTPKKKNRKQKIFSWKKILKKNTKYKKNSISDLWTPTSPATAPFDKPQTSRSFKHELAYQGIFTNLLFTIKASIEIIRGRIHGEEGQ